jgi:hypothetical protein
MGDNIQMERHKVLLFAHSRSASLHCSEAPAIPNVLLGMTQLKHWKQCLGGRVGIGAVCKTAQSKIFMSYNK